MNELFTLVILCYRFFFLKQEKEEDIFFAVIKNDVVYIKPNKYII